MPGALGVCAPGTSVCTGNRGVLLWGWELDMPGREGLRWGLWGTALDLPVAGLHRQVQLSVVVGKGAWVARCLHFVREAGNAKLEV